MEMCVVIVVVLVLITTEIISIKHSVIVVSMHGRRV